MINMHRTGEEIDTAVKLIEEECRDGSLWCIPLYSTLPYQVRIFRPWPYAGYFRFNLLVDANERI
jgi:hypothetical protein